MLFITPRAQLSALLAPRFLRTHSGGSFISSTFVALRHCSVSKDISAAKTQFTRSFVPLTAAEFVQIAPMILLREALRRHVSGEKAEDGKVTCRDVVSRELFDHYCAESHVGDSEEALRLLQDSGSLVVLSGGRAVHLRPAQFLRMCEECGDTRDTSGGEKGGGNFFLDVAAERLAAARAEEAAMRRELEPALRSAAKWRQVVWGGALFLFGAYMAIVSRLTFFDFDWDIMEPLTYFCGASFSILFFVYFLCCGRAYAVHDCDKTILSKRVRKDTSSGFDWEKYEAVMNKIDEERRMMDKIREWVRQH